MGLNGDSNEKFANRIHQVYVPLTSVILMVISLLGFWINISNSIDAKFEPIQNDIRLIREVIVEHHGRLPNP